MPGMFEGRRQLLRGSLAGLLITGSPGILAAATVRDRKVDVRSFGARGDGVNDDTGAIQAAIDELGQSGGAVELPPGRYLIDALRSVRLRSHVDLHMSPDTRLVAKPNSATRAYVVLMEGVDDAGIYGGGIIGERDTHLGMTGEWGHGVMIRGSSHVSVRDVVISQCWGDGISIGAAGKGEGSTPSSDILIANVVCRGNRRQGLTIGRSRRVRVIDSEFSDTHGTKPEYGIDIEPDRPGRADDISIERCILRGNLGGGIQVFHPVSNVSISECTIDGNGVGIQLVAADAGVITGNTIKANLHAGVALGGATSGYRVENNRFSGNNTSLHIPAAVGRSMRGHVQLAKDAHDNSVAANQYD